MDIKQNNIKSFLKEKLSDFNDEQDDYKNAMLFFEQYSAFLVSKLENLAKYLEEDGCEELHVEYIKTINEAQEFIKNIWQTYKDQSEQVESSVKLIKGFEKELKANKEITILFRFILLFLIIFTFLLFWGQI